MEETFIEMCKKEGDIFVACVEKKKFVPPCIDLIILWDRCMTEKQKLMAQNLKSSTQIKKEK